MRKNIHLDKTVIEPIESYIEEALDLLDSIDINVEQKITFKFKSVRRPSYGLAMKNGEGYLIVLNSKIHQDKDGYMNTIIHEIVHVLTDLKGGCNGHGKEFNRIGRYILEKTKYNVTRYAYKGAERINDNPFLSLNPADQSDLLNSMIIRNDAELIRSFKDIYFSLAEIDSRNKLAIYYMENHLFKKQDLVKAFCLEFPYYINNAKLRKELSKNYLDGRYDSVLDTFAKCVQFEGLFALKKEYQLVAMRTDRRFGHCASKQSNHDK